MSDWAKELLADVARKVVPEVANSRLREKRVKEMLTVLERELLGLLEAGQTMAESIATDGGNQKALQLFVAAKKAAAAKENK